MALGSPADEGGPSWPVDDIPYHALVHDQIRDDRRLFHILASASFIEITSDLYTHNLVEFFRGDDEIVEWLEAGWEKEELQHGAALKRYVQTAWPDFDWEAAYRSSSPTTRRCCTSSGWPARGRSRWPRAASWRPAPPPSTACCRSSAPSRC